MYRLLAGLVALSLSSAALADSFDTTRWHIGAKQNEEALKIVDSGEFDINTQTEEGYSLLHYAAGAGNLPMVQALLARGADPRLEANTGTSIYEMAIGTMVKAEIRKAVAAWNGGGGVRPARAAPPPPAA